MMSVFSPRSPPALALALGALAASAQGRNEAQDACDLGA